MAYDYYRPIPRDVLQNNSNGSEVVNDSGIELANANQTVVNRRHNSPTNANLSPDGPNMGNTLSQPADTNTSSSAGSPLMGIWSSFSHARWNPFNSGYEAVNTSTTNAASHTQIDFLDVENPVLDNLENSNGGDRAVHRTTDNNPDNVIGECCICYNGVLHNPSDAARMPNHQNVDSSTSTARSNGSLISSLIDQSLNRQHPLRYMVNTCVLCFCSFL